MMDKNSAYMKSLEKVGREWSEAKEERDARKQHILETCGPGSEELRAWYKEDAAAKFPFGSGVSKAYQAWKWSIDCGEDEVEMNGFLWDEEAGDFVDTLRKAGIGTFVYTSKSSAVMDNIHQFVAAGCTMMEPCTVTRVYNGWGEKEVKEVIGIRFMVNASEE